MKNERRNNLFEQVPVAKVNRNLFDLSHEVKLSCKMGYLIPVLCIETLPGDSIRDTMNCFIRLAPMLAPVMHRIDVTTHFFFVPNRLLTDYWEDFITGGQDGTEAPILPYVRYDTVEAEQAEFNITGLSSLWDYLGLPTNEQLVGGPWVQEQVSALPFRACGKIWNDYYRDPNFDDEMDLGTELAGNVSASAVVQGGYMDIRKYRRAFEKDYFTSALPFAQRGAQVLMPLSGVATQADIEWSTARVARDEAFTDAPDASGNITVTSGNFSAAIPPGEPFYLENIENINFQNATTTINDFRRALALQRWMEANARGGARYTEQIQSHFNVQVPDYRLQRAEYVGGGKQPVQISEVVQTYQVQGLAPGVGDMYGHGLSVGRTNRFQYRCQEHGFLIGFMSITFRTAYFQGLPKMWSRQIKFDYAWPELAHLGEQEILSKELFFEPQVAAQADNQELFGYIPRYAEYKFHNDRVAGDFKGDLSIWHLARYFVARPVLDRDFTTLIEEGTTQEGSAPERIFQAGILTDYLWCQLYHHLTAKRPLPYFGVPKII